MNIDISAHYQQLLQQFCATVTYARDTIVVSAFENKMNSLLYEIYNCFDECSGALRKKRKKYKSKWHVRANRNNIVHNFVIDNHFFELISKFHTCQL